MVSEEVVAEVDASALAAHTVADQTATLTIDHHTEVLTMARTTTGAEVALAAQAAMTVLFPVDRQVRCHLEDRAQEVTEVR